MRDLNKILSGLSDFELIELYYLATSETTSTATILVSFFFAYLVVAHLASSQLNWLQIALLSIVYSVFVFAGISSIHGTASTVARANAALVGGEPDFRWAWATVGFFVIGWLLTLVYMIQARRRCP